MQYGQQAADEMKAKETLFRNFFQNVEVVMRQHNTVKHRSKWDVSFVTGHLFAHPNGARKLLHDTTCLFICWRQLNLALPRASTRPRTFRCQRALFCDPLNWSSSVTLQDATCTVLRQVDTYNMPLSTLYKALSLQRTRSLVLKCIGQESHAMARLQEGDGKERGLAKNIQQAQQRVHEALLDNLNSKAALDALLDLVKDTNKYLADRQGNPQGQYSNQCSSVHFCTSKRPMKASFLI